ncbi:hypothetical protein GCM10010372_80430 [Streptomyces tauricus]|nr:hypothetical protein GCM10010372_80430 [Streptomyces tauricus]
MGPARSGGAHPTVLRPITEEPCPRQEGPARLCGKAFRLKDLCGLFVVPPLKAPAPAHGTQPEPTLHRSRPVDGAPLHLPAEDTARLGSSEWRRAGEVFVFSLWV